MSRTDPSDELAGDDLPNLQPTRSPTWYYSSIVVSTRPEHFEGCVAKLRTLRGVEVHHGHPASGRIVVVQETDSHHAQEEGLRRIQALPTVLAAALVEYRIDRHGDASERSRKGEPS